MLRMAVIVILLLLVPGSAASEASAEGASGRDRAFSELIGGDGSSQGPLFIKSNSLSLDSQKRIFTYKGNVEMVRDDLTITADTVIGRYDESNQIQTVLCQDNVVVTRGPEMRATSNRAVYRVSVGTIELTEDPELARSGNVLSADKITVFVNEDRSEAEGNVRAKVLKSDGLDQGVLVGNASKSDSGARQEQEVSEPSSEASGGDGTEGEQGNDSEPEV